MDQLFIKYWVKFLNKSLLNYIKAEVESVLNCGVSPNKIIFANACKPNTFIRYVRSVGVDVMTFDNEEELIKISKVFPEARLLLRIKADDSHSTSKLGLKFGAEVESFDHLLKTAKNLNLNVIGIAFHVGSGCQSTEPYSDALKKARLAFDIGIDLGFKMNVLDIGGGFPGSGKNIKLSFESIASSVNKDLNKYFPSNGNELTIIAEPGRYYAMSAFNLMTLVTSKRSDYWNNEKLFMYYINDGLYGSFSSVVTGNKVVEPIPVLKNEDDLKSRNVYSSVIWGPTCDSYDCIRRNFEMTEVNVGEWLMFENMGSYSMSAASHFNGMPLPGIKLLISDYSEKILKKMKNWSQIEKLIEVYK